MTLAVATAHLARWSVAVFLAALVKGINGAEADISTEADPAQARAWLFEANGYAWRACRARGTAAEGPIQPDRLRRKEADPALG